MSELTLTEVTRCFLDSGYESHLIWPMTVYYDDQHHNPNMSAEDLVSEFEGNWVGTFPTTREAVIHMIENYGEGRKIPEVLKSYDLINWDEVFDAIINYDVMTQPFDYKLDQYGYHVWMVQTA